jgi:alkaline phosphatase D
MKKYFVLAMFAISAHVSLAISKIVAGPMLGYTEMTEVCIWAQADKPGTIELRYWVNGQDNPVQKSIEVNATEDNGLTVHVVLTNLAPGVKYNYTVAGRNAHQLEKLSEYEFTTQALWQFRTDPPAFKLAMGSCAFINETEYDRPGEPYGGGYEIFNSIADKDPDMMLWLGDNVYLREVDFYSKSGIIHRYSHSRSLPEMQRLLSSCANYAIWDDHDYGPNDSNGSYVHKDWTKQAFEMFWANPSYGLPGGCGDKGITTNFLFNDIEFFLLDNRFYRTSADIKGAEKPTVLGEEQLNWLIQSLKMSKAPFKLVTIGGQFLNTVGKYENYAGYAQEREKIIELIKINGIKGVIFLSGDRHGSELSMLPLDNNNAIYDLTVSPLTSKPYDFASEENELRVKDTYVGQRNFAVFEFSGKYKSRVLVMSVYDSAGKLLWTKEILQCP